MGELERKRITNDLSPYYYINVRVTKLGPLNNSDLKVKK